MHTQALTVCQLADSQSPHNTDRLLRLRAVEAKVQKTDSKQKKKKGRKRHQR